MADCTRRRSKEGPNLTASISGEQLALYRLTLVEGMGPIRLRELVRRFGSASAVLAATRAQLEETERIGPKLAQALRDPSTAERAAASIEHLQRIGGRIVFESDADYPDALRKIPAAPVLFSILGQLVPEDGLAVAIVGSRRSSRYGRSQAERFAKQLATRGVTVVSGLARGIDAAAHRAALATGGRTLAVLASGLANVYPPEHGELADEISRNGAVLSEAPAHGPPLGSLFPRRNRIISGLSLGVLVIEAARRSGALSTAHHAVEQNRDVFAIPGRLTDAASEGTHYLIQQGAALVTDVGDILEQLGPIEGQVSARSEPERTAPPGLNEAESAIWSALGGESVEVETILQRTGRAPGEISALLLGMELKRLVRRQPGNRYERVGP